MPTTVTVLSTRGDNSGAIYDVSGTKTAYPNELRVDVGQDVAAAEQYRSFFHFETAGVVPVGKVVTQIQWEIIVDSITQTETGEPSTWQWIVYTGQTFIEATLNISDWDQGTYNNDVAPGFPNQFVDLPAAAAAFDRTLNFDLSAWDFSSATSETAFWSVTLWNGSTAARRQKLHITYDDPPSPPPESNVASLYTPHAGI